MTRLGPLSLSSALCLLLAGCPGETTSAETAETGDTEGTTGDDDTDTGDTTEGTESETAGEGVCGDGTLDEGEECDDGNLDEGDGCSATCTVTSCGLVWERKDEIADGNTRVDAVAIDDNGDVFRAGQIVNEDNDAWISRINETDLLWSTEIDSGAGSDSARAIALGQGGEVYVTGRTQQDAEAIWIAALDGASGSILWEQRVDGLVAETDDVGTGITVTPDGDVVVVGEMYMDEADIDVWVSKRSAADGLEIWSSTWSGSGDGSSSDRGGDVAVAGNGDIWVGAREHIAFDTHDATLLHFDGDGNLLDSFQPLAGDSHVHDAVGVAVDDSGVYFAVEKEQFPLRTWLYRLDFDGAEQWVITEVELAELGGEEPIGDEWAIRGMAINSAGELAVGGVFQWGDAAEAIDWGEAWVARMDSDGNFLCRGRHQVLDDAFIPPSVGVGGVGSNAAGNFGASGTLNAGQGQQKWIWTGYFLE